VRVIDLRRMRRRWDRLAAAPEFAELRRVLVRRFETARREFESWRARYLREISYDPRAVDLHHTWLRRDVLAASLAINVLGLALPIMILQVYDRVLREHAETTLAFLAGMVAVAFLLEFALRLLRSAILNEAGARFDHQTTLRGLKRMLAADIETFRQDAAGVHAERFQAIQQVRAFYAQTALLLFTDLPFVFVFFLLMVFIAGWVALVPLFFFGVFSLAAYLLSQAISRANVEHDRADAKRYNFLIETLTGIHTVKGLTLEPLLQRRHERLQKASAESLADITRITGRVQALSMAFGQTATVATVGFGALAVVAGSLSVGGLAATTMLTGRMLQPVLRGISAWARYQAIRVSEQKIRALDAIPGEITGGRALPERIEGAISVQNMSFTYRNATVPTLSNITLAVPARGIIGLTGSTATGKSTLLHLICGLLKPSSGRIRLDGHDLAALDASAVRARVAVLATHATIFRGTLLENLTSFKDGVVRERALELAGVLGLDDYIAALPQGLDTAIGGSDTLVPSGVGKRIAIARALATDPAVILFDNAHTGFDQESDNRLREYLASLRGKRTIVLVTQRPSYLSLCDSLYGLHKGSLIEFDSVQAATAPPPDESEEELQELIA
jgi:ATP-binding cassette subfamily C protein LapB